MDYSVRFPGLGINLKLNNVAFEINDFSVYWYGVIIAAGFLLAMCYCMKIAPKVNLNSDHLFDATFIGLIAGVIGARLYYVIFFPIDNRYWENPLEIFDIRDGGLGIYGGIIAGLLAAVFVAKWRKMSVGAILDVGCLGFLIGQGVGRWANFINQEAFGGPTTLPWGMRSQATELVVPDSAVHPCFFYESMLCFIGFILLHFFTKKMRRYDGQTCILYIIWYGLSRFFVEGLRTDSLMLPFIPIRVSQAIALASVIGGIVVLYILRNRTALTGCGKKEIMELNGIEIVIVKKEKKKVDEEEPLKEVPEESTLFKGQKYMYQPDDKRVIDEEVETDNNVEVDEKTTVLDESQEDENE